MSATPIAALPRPVLKSKLLIALIAVVLAGSFLRLFRIDSVPPGLNTDEATAGINAESFLDGNLKLFYHPFDEPIFVYTSSIGVAIMGPTAMGLHLPAAFLGILAVVGTFLLGKKLFGSQVGILAASGMAVSYWPVETSRLGFRAIALPTFELFAFYFLWRALKGSSLRDYAIGGVLLGLALYTYPSSRVLPVIAGVMVVAVLVWRRWRLGSVKGLSIYVSASLVAFVPLGFYFLSNPESFSGRFEQTGVSVSTPADSSQAADSVARTAGMFFIKGDPKWKYNLADLPIFNPPWTVLFLSGLVISLIRVRRPEYFFLMLWFVLGLLPGALTDEAPHNLRTIVSQPAAYFFPALAIAGLISILLKRSNSDWARRGSLAAVVILLLATGWNTYDLYFNHWATDPNVAEIFYPDIDRAMAYLRTVRPDQKVYLSAQYQDLMTIMRNYYTWRQTVPLPSIFDATQGIVMNSSGSTTLYIIPESAPASDWTKSFLARASLVKEEPSPTGGQSLFRAYLLNGGPPHQPSSSLEGRFGELAQMLGYDLSANPRAGGTLSTTIYNRPIKQAEVEGDYKFFAHLVDSSSYVWSQAEGISGDPAQWTPTEQILTNLVMTVPADAPPKEYTVEIGMYSLTHGRLAVVNSQRQVSGTVLQTSPFQIETGPGSDIVQNKQAQIGPLAIGDNLSLIGVESDTKANPGESARVTLYWKPVGAIKGDDLVRLALVDGSGKSAGMFEGELVDAAYPTTVWTPGKVIRNSYLIAVPPEAAAGNYKLMGTLLDRKTRNPKGPAQAFAAVQMESVAHRFTVPPIANPLSLKLGDAIELIGYDVDHATAKPGSVLPVTLYWRSLQPTTINYTVFVHLLDAQSHVLGQRDRTPANGNRPTSTWVASEVFVDRFRIPVLDDIASGDYTLEIGMYDPNTMQRLAMVSSDGIRLDSDRLLIGNIRFP